MLFRHLKALQCFHQVLKWNYTGKVQVIRTMANGSQQTLPQIKDVYQGFEISFPDSRHQEINEYFDYLWLRDHCRCSKCYNSKTFQKEVNFLKKYDIKPIKVEIESSGTLHVQWSDDHDSIYDLSWLQRHSFGGHKKKQNTELKLWKGNLKSNDYPSVKYHPDMDSDSLIRRALTNIFVYGFTLINEVKPTLEETETVIRRIAPIQKTFWGEMWSVFAVDEEGDIQDSAFSNVPIPPHNDCTYFTDAPSIQVFHCLQKSTTGGETILVDGFEAAKQLRESDPLAYDYLSTTPVESSFINNQGNYFVCNDTVLKHCPFTKEIQQIRFNPLDLAPLTTIPQQEIRKFYKSYEELANIIYDPDNQLTISLNPGTILMFDNWRVLHARTAFTGNRKLGGCNISRTDYFSRIKKLGLI